MPVPSGWRAPPSGSCDDEHCRTHADKAGTGASGDLVVEDVGDAGSGDRGGERFPDSLRGGQDEISPESAGSPALRVVAGDQGTIAIFREPSPVNVHNCSWLVESGPGPFGLVRIASDDLQEAALRGDLATARRLVDAGVSVNAPLQPESDLEYMCLLHILASKPELPNAAHIITEMIECQANLNVRSSIGTTPLARACLAKHIDAVEVLLKARADPAVMDDHGRTAARCAVLPWGDVVDQELHTTRSVSIVELLGQFGVNLDDGGDVPPIVEAVRTLDQELVEALLEGGATADGLHDAVEKGPMPLISELVQAEANPFTKDSKGRAVMDIALARGEEDITALLRDYIGDLQRKQHPHLQTLLEQQKLEAQADELALLNANGDLRRTMQMRQSQRVSGMLNARKGAFAEWLEEVGLQKYVDRLQILCRKMNKNRVFQTVMFSCLVLALFLPDAWVLSNLPSNDPLDVVLLLILSAFTVEFTVQVVGLWRSYVGSFFFWMDLIGVLSVPLDHSVVVNSLPTSFDNAVVMRAARMAKLGARAGRFTKLVKLLRFLPGMKDVGSEGTAKVISGVLNRALAMRVSGLIIIMVMVLPIFELVTYPENDFSMKMWVDEVSDIAGLVPHEIAEALADFDAFFSEKSYYPFLVVFRFPNGTSRAESLSRGPPVRSQNRVLLRSVIDTVETEAEFNFQVPNQIDALCNMLLIILIIVLMMGSALILSSSVSGIVLVPLEALFDNVQRIASKIFNSVTNLTGKEEEEEPEEEHGESSDPMGAETKLLEKVLQKIAVLSEITMKSSPLDAEQFAKLDERDRAMLQGYGAGGNVSNQNPGASGGQAGSAGAAQKGSTEAAMRGLNEVGITPQAFDSWELNVAELGDVARHQLVFACLILHHGPAGEKWAGKCSSFIDECSLAYRTTAGPRDAKPGPYHNWVHAADVTFTTAHILRYCGTEHYLSTNERFALTVAAVCHDMGHWGFNNTFLIESSHDLAVRYNDISPLENMSAAKVFEIARLEGNGIFSNLDTVQYREVRSVVIEAILHTDFRHHYAMVKEVQNLHDVNLDLFDTSEDMYKEGSAEFPTREVKEFLRGGDVKRQLRLIFVHLADISSTMKPWPLAELWANMLIEEMTHQGDVEKERGLPMQPLYDRERLNKAYSQIGFIEFFVAPLAFGMSSIIPPLDLLVEHLCSNLDAWLRRWVEESMPPDEEQKRVSDRIARLCASSRVGASIAETLGLGHGE